MTRGNIYSSGNAIVDENAKPNISGNIIPQAWYKTIIRDSGKPNLTAIVILADIVYWYKPVEVRDEVTGQVVESRKKFKADLLQRSYQQISEQSGSTVRISLSRWYRAFMENWINIPWSMYWIPYGTVGARQRISGH